MPIHIPSADRYEVSLPNTAGHGSSTVSYAVFDTREEAIAFAKKEFGADDEGKIDVINRVPCSGKDRRDHPNRPVIVGSVMAQVTSKGPTLPPSWGEDDFKDVIFTDKNERYRLVWEYLGEGGSGDYDPADPTDAPLLRATVEFWEDEAHSEDLSYCTCAPTNTPLPELQRMAFDLFARFDASDSVRHEMELWTHRTRPPACAESAPVLQDGGKDWGLPCSDCGDVPTLHPTGLCGPCCTGEADTYGGNW